MTVGILNFLKNQHWQWQTFEIFNTISAVIASNDGKNLNIVRVKNILLFTAKQGIQKYNVNIFDMRRTRRHHVNACNLNIF